MYNSTYKIYNGDVVHINLIGISQKFLFENWTKYGGRERNYIPLKFCVFDVLKNINYGIVV